MRRAYLTTYKLKTLILLAILNIAAIFLMFQLSMRIDIIVSFIGIALVNMGSAIFYVKK